GIDVVFHLAAMAGPVKSGTDFGLDQNRNPTATQRLLDSVWRTGPVQRLPYASTASVYGRFSHRDEKPPTRPNPPHRRPTLGAEDLCRSYEDLGVPTVVLRYFSVYGPRQRPDMGYHRFIGAMLDSKPITVFGDGLQARGNTYSDD